MSSYHTPPVLFVHNLSAIFPDGDTGLHALGPVTFSVCPQEFICVLGPSGSGKSTLLRILAGLIKPTSGTISFSGTTQRPKIGFVFQDATLMPWRTVLENILLPLEVENVPAQAARQKAQELVSLVGLNGFETSLPRDLSGGMAQRVALARALVHDPDILLLDEPFGALDALTRERMWTELLRIWQAQPEFTKEHWDEPGAGKTVIMVTHSISEALFLADRVLVLSARPGRVKLDMLVDLPRPRADEMRYTEHFGRLAKRLKEAIE